jgi:hypothetical protein
MEESAGRLLGDRSECSKCWFHQCVFIVKIHEPARICARFSVCLLCH